jgi:hypothetical protein
MSKKFKFVEPSSVNRVVEDGWIDVPKGWSECNPPPQARAYDRIEVMFDDGVVDRGRPGVWAISWCGDDDWGVRIIKFRKLVTE